MGFSRFGLLLLLRLVVISIAITAFVFLFFNPRYVFATILIATIVIGLTYELWYFLNKTNREVSRFLSAARYADFTQNFEFDRMGGGFQALGDTFSDILEKLKKSRLDQEVELRSLRAMVENIPVALISVDQESHLALLNNAARHLFAARHLSKLEDLKQYGENFYHTIRQSKAGEKNLVSANMDGTPLQLSINVTEINSAAGNLRLISLHDIGRELEVTQLSSWQDLVRVLTHEIMNSITPVASLSQTTADMAADAQHQLENNTLSIREMNKIQNAAATLSKRANGLMEFVSNYRQLTRLPEPERKKIKVRDLFQHVDTIFKASKLNSKTSLSWQVEPLDLEIYADAQQMEQILINLLKNADQALGKTEQAQISLCAYINPRGQATIAVKDNGPGIEEKILNKVFLPYFTTKPDGSGIGLALARQVMILHGGTIKVENISDGGAQFTLIF